MKNRQKPIFTGACTALVTPFRDGRIDYEALTELIELQIAGGIDALLINGTTGESATLSDEEKRALISFAVRRVDGRVPAIAGVGSNDTARTVALSAYARDAGANALLVVTPYYNKASNAGLVRHYQTVADAADMPIILYNVPSRTGVNIPLEVYDALASHENIVAVKEASPSIPDFARLSQKCGNRLTLYSGNDDLITPTLALGGMGVISVIANALPRETGDICRLWSDGKIKAATELQLRLLPLINAIFSEVNPIPIKALLAHLGLCREEYRLPLCPMNEGKKREMLEVFESFKF